MIFSIFLFFKNTFYLTYTLTFDLSNVYYFLSYSFYLVTLVISKMFSATENNACRTQGFQTLNDHKKDLRCTKVCKYYKVGCNNKDCTFAHKVSDIKPTMCFFKDSCKRPTTCGLYHPGDKIPSQQELFAASERIVVPIACANNVDEYFVLSQTAKSRISKELYAKGLKNCTVDELNWYFDMGVITDDQLLYFSSPPLPTKKPLLVSTSATAPATSSGVIVPHEVKKDLKNCRWSDIEEEDEIDTDDYKVFQKKEAKEKGPLNFAALFKKTTVTKPSSPKKIYIKKETLITPPKEPTTPTRKDNTPVVPPNTPIKQDVLPSSPLKKAKLTFTVDVNNLPKIIMSLGSLDITPSVEIV